MTTSPRTRTTRRRDHVNNAVVNQWLADQLPKREPRAERRLALDVRRPRVLPATGRR